MDPTAGLTNDERERVQRLVDALDPVRATINAVLEAAAEDDRPVLARGLLRTGVLICKKVGLRPRDVFDTVDDEVLRLTRMEDEQAKREKAH